MRCHYCAWLDNLHAESCPNNPPFFAVQEKRIRLWELGNRIGRSGATPDWPADTNPTMKLGYERGVVALEQAENR